MDGFERIGGQPSFPMFGECLGSRFRVVPDDGAVVELTLIEATKLTSRGHPARPEPFSLVFRGPAGLRLPQRIYSFEHEALGAFEMFIVPIVPDGQGPRYEAVFN